MTDIKPTPAEIINALTEARTLLANGWCKGKAQDGDKFCAVGALAEATCTKHDAFAAPGYLIWREALAALNTQVPAPYPNLVTFNDATNQSAVLGVFDKAITYVKELNK